MSGRSSRQKIQTRTGENTVILSLDMVSCLLTFCNVPLKRDWNKEQQRTVTLTKEKDQSDDICTMEIYDKKHKLQLKQSVVFCGIISYSTKAISSKKTLQVQQRFDLIFKETTATVIFNDGDQRAQKLYKYCSERCRDRFKHVTTNCVDLESFPPSCYRLDGKSQVLVSLTGSRFTLSAKQEPHTSLISWSIDNITPRLGSDSLRIDVAGDGTYVFKSRIDKSWISCVHRWIQEYLHLDSKYEELIDEQDPSYLDLCGELACEKCRQLYLTCLKSPDLSGPDCFNLDFNEYVRMNGSVYERMTRMFSDSSAYFPTCAYQGKNGQLDKSGYLTTGCEKISDKDNTFYLTTSATNRDMSEDEPKRNSGDVTIDHETKTSNDQVTTGHETKTSNDQATTGHETKTSNDQATTSHETKTSNDQVTTSHETKTSNDQVTTGHETKRSNDQVTTGHETKRSNDQVTTGHETKTSNDQVTTSHETKTSNDQVTTDSSSPDSSDPGENKLGSSSGEQTIDLLNEVIQTLSNRHKGPNKDMLQLPTTVRVRLCFGLYQSGPQTVGSMADWQLFGEHIGLTAEAINLIAIFVKTHSLNQTAAELVLRHWQYVYNTYGETDSNGPCPYACNKDNLIRILDQIGRADLVELIQKNRLHRVG